MENEKWKMANGKSLFLHYCRLPGIASPKMGSGTHMNRLRRLSLPLLATVCLAGLPACGEDDVKREADKTRQEAEKAGDKAKTAAEKAKTEAEKAKKDAEKAKEDVDGK